jgi:hypothetical protein
MKPNKPSFSRADHIMFKFRPPVTSIDIAEGSSCIPSECVGALAITRFLALHDPRPNPTPYHVKIDKGLLKFNFPHEGVNYRWHAIVAKAMKACLLQVDRERDERMAAKQAGKRFESKVLRPFSFTVEAFRGVVVPPKPDAERQAQINAARAARIAAGKPDKKYRNARDRLVGFSATV